MDALLPVERRHHSTRRGDVNIARCAHVRAHNHRSQEDLEVKLTMFDKHYCKVCPI
jgi:hypothetical protein